MYFFNTLDVLVRRAVGRGEFNINRLDLIETLLPRAKFKSLDVFFGFILIYHKFTTE